MNRFQRFAMALALLAGGSATAPAFACTCVQPASIAAASDQVDVVFRGRLVQHSGREAIFEVERVWKGEVGRRFPIDWRLENGDCNGFRPEALKIGADLLVFAKRGRDGVYRSNICYPTKPVSEADAELHALGPGRPPGR